MALSVDGCEARFALPIVFREEGAVDAVAVYCAAPESLAPEWFMRREGGRLWLTRAGIAACSAALEAAGVPRLDMMLVPRSIEV